MKKKILFVVCLCATTMLQAAVSKTVNISAGGLSTALTATEKASITNLTVTGIIDARDVKFMRDSIANLTTLNISTVTIQAYTGTAGTLSTSTSFPANEMPKSSFRNMKAILSSITLPSSLTSIGSYAFGNCNGLTSITIPNTVTTIGDWAFCGSSGLTSIIIPNSVASIGHHAFFGCSGFTGITLPTSVKSIGESAFYGCSGLTNIIIPSSVTTIGNSTFTECSGLTGITIPNTVTAIGDWAFLGCNKLTSITIPNTVTSIGSGAFYGCTTLKSVSIPNSVTSIGESAFCNCTAISNVTISNAVTLISNNTFSNCTSLTSVTIPNSVTAIEDWAFYDCAKLTSLTIGDAITSIGEYAFSDCTGLNSIYTYIAKPAALSSSTFTSVNKSSCTLYVPANSISAYKAASIWNEFTRINNLSSTYIQKIPLISGWNIISSNVIPSSTDLKDVIQPLIDRGNLVKVMDESGKAIENFSSFGGWNNGIGNFSQSEGYKVYMTSADTLTLEGKSITLPLNIALSAGWNIISYPCSDSQGAITMVQSLIDAGKLKKVMDESGKTIEDFGDFGGWKDNIGNFTPGKGYKIYMTESGTLSMTSTMLRSAISTSSEVIEPTYFTKVYEGNGTDHMNINLVNLGSSTLQAGDEIGVFDGKACVGSATIASDHIAEGIISIPTSCNDSQADTVNGFTPGNAITIKLYSKGFYYNLTAEKVSGSDTYVKNGSLFAEVLSKELSEGGITDISKTKETVQIVCYPNPFVEEVSIDVQNTESKALTVGIYNLLGQKIKEIYKGDTDALHLKWNGTDEKGNQVIPGVYLCKVNGSSKKIVLIGR